MNNYYIEFTPPGQNVYRLPILAVDKFDAERITFELAIILHAKATGNNPFTGTTDYETVKGLEFHVDWS